MIDMLREFIVRRHLEQRSRLGQVLEFIKDQFGAEMLLDVVIYENSMYTVRGKQDTRIALPVELVSYLAE